MHPDKVPLGFGIKITPHHHIPFTIPRDWHEILSIRYTSQCKSNYSKLLRLTEIKPCHVCDDVWLFKFLNILMFLK